jgi:hypothetical protein
MTDRDDERRLQDAFARLREDEARRAPTLAQLLARSRAEERAPRFAWLRVALPLAGAAAAGFVWWIASSAPAPERGELAEAPPQRLELDGPPEAPRVIALGSLRSPTDALLAPPIAAWPSGFSDSLIPAPAAPATPRDQQSRITPARRSPA